MKRSNRAGVVQVEKSPFLHAKIAPVLNARKAEQLLYWLDRTKWQRGNQPFQKFDVPSVQNAKRILQNNFLDQQTIGSIRSHLEFGLHTHLGQEATIAVHRYSSGAGLTVHTDGDVEEARFVLNLNHNWQPNQGGIWVLSTSSALKEPVCYLPPLHNTGFGFLTTKDSYHSLSERHSSVGYTIVLGFLATIAAKDPEKSTTTTD